MLRQERPLSRYGVSAVIRPLDAMSNFRNSWAFVDQRHVPNSRMSLLYPVLGIGDQRQIGVAFDLDLGL
jgi:hypothetical protein